jgi:hypothetical protein
MKSARLAPSCVSIVMVALDGRFLDRAVHALDLAADSDDRAQVFQSDAAQRSNLIARR